MRMSSAFPSKYLKAADLEGRQITVTIDRVELENITDEESKPVLHFIGKEKGMVLNKTNANNISFLYGDETDEWHGKKVVLFEAIVDFQGRSVPSIRIKGPVKTQSHPVPRPDPITSGPQPAMRDLNDDIPF